MALKDRFIRYAKVETTAGKGKEFDVSNDKILDLSSILLDELQELKPDSISVNRCGIIDAKFYCDKQKDMVAFLAHLDTSNQASGKDVNPRVIENYNGEDIVLNDDVKIEVKDFPYLKNAISHTLVVTDGKTLLGADDKAGVAIIMEALIDVLKSKDHRPIEIIFTTDEEIGLDASHICMNEVKAKYGYTVDGGDYHDVEIESFNAASIDVNIIGKSIHPGSAKDKMVNAAQVLMDLHYSLPQFLRPEHTSKKEPFYHLTYMKGEVEKASCNYIVRSFSTAQLEEMISLFNLSVKRQNEVLGYEAIKCVVSYQYKNMKTVLDEHKEILKEVEEVYKKNGIDISYSPIRGGTTGSQLSFMGLPCPNLGTGGYNYHGNKEYLDLDEMEIMKNIVIDLMK